MLDPANIDEARAILPKMSIWQYNNSGHAPIVQKYYNFGPVLPGDRMAVCRVYCDSLGVMKVQMDHLTSVRGPGIEFFYHQPHFILSDFELVGYAELRRNDWLLKVAALNDLTLEQAYINAAGEAQRSVWNMARDIEINGILKDALNTPEPVQAVCQCPSAELLWGGHRSGCSFKK